MKIYEKQYIAENKNGCVLALGNFDGVHKGHMLLLDRAREYARENSLAFGVYTFVKHPKLSAGKRHELLMTLQYKLSALDYSAKADFVYLEAFDDVKEFSPEEFVEYIINKFNVKCTFCGENFTFGKRASGNSELLFQLMTKKGASAAIVETLKINGATVSSSEIRRLLHEGDAKGAARLLSEPYGFTSMIVHGASLGKKLGFPTINQAIPDELIIPAFGVYASCVIIDGKEYIGVTDIGVKPTVSSDERQVLAETYIIDFDKDVYGKYAGIVLYKRLRGEKKFKSLNELTENIALNVQQTKEFFKEMKDEK